LAERFCRKHKCAIFAGMALLLDLFRAPFPLDVGIARQLRLGFVFGVFVFLFLYVFRPFGLADYEGGLLVYTLQNGMLTALFVPGMNLAASRLFPRYFDEMRWTTGREISWTLLVVALLGLANAFHAAAFQLVALDLPGILRFEGYTLAVAAFPVGISVLLKQGVLMRQHQAQSVRMSASLLPAQAAHPPAHDVAHATPEDLAATPPGADAMLQLPNGKEERLFEIAALVYLRAADNYVEVYQLSSGKVQRHVLRATLAEAEARLAAYTHWIRCHKSYLVNLHHVQHITGNAQGCQLHFAADLAPAPVARQRIEAVRATLSVHP
jgi:hypothetical protein